MEILKEATEYMNNEGGSVWVFLRKQKGSSIFRVWGLKILHMFVYQYKMKEKDLNEKTENPKLSSS
jgi:hypothetical protein